MRALARLRLAATADGGLRAPLPSPCRQLLLRTEPAGLTDPVVIGVQITPSTEDELRPGATDLPVLLMFWDDTAETTITVGTTFTLRYPLRVVGTGLVTEVLSG